MAKGFKLNVDAGPARAGLTGYEPEPIKKPFEKPKSLLESVVNLQNEKDHTPLKPESDTEGVEEARRASQISRQKMAKQLQDAQSSTALEQNLQPILEEKRNLIENEVQRRLRESSERDKEGKHLVQVLHQEMEKTVGEKER